MGQRYDGVTYHDYDALVGIRSSDVRAALVSPRHYAHRQANPVPDTPALRLGRATHTAVLEPIRFLDEYVLAEFKDRRTKAYKEWAAQQTKEILVQSDWDLAKGIREAVRVHEVAAPLLAQPGAAEVTLTWTDEATGLDCKARPDWLTADGTLVDLKTARDVSTGVFGAAAHRYGYHTQLAFYADGCRAAGHEVKQVKIIAVESAPPHDVVVYTLPWMVMDLGGELYREGLRVIAAAKERNEYRGQAPDCEVPLELPAYAMGLDEGDIAA